MKTTVPRLLSEAELARLVNRSNPYLRHARERGLITPLGTIGAGRFVYAPDAVDEVRAIDRPVMRRAPVVGITPEAERIHRIFAAQLPNPAA